jgi:hypothetical protein
LSGLRYTARMALVAVLVMPIVSCSSPDTGAADSNRMSSDTGAPAAAPAASAGRAPSAGARMQVTLEFPVGNDCIETRPFTRIVPESPAVARLLVEALIAGAVPAERAEGAVSPFPEGSDVNSVVLRAGVLTVDFNERLRNVGGSCAATAIRRSVTRTLERLPTVKRVVITAAGSEKLALQP